MSTRTLISAKMQGKVYTIYCHHDGYPEHIIPLLRDCYNAQEKIEALIMLGDTSAIYETLEKCRPYADGTENGEPYEKNAPEITDKWSRSDFLYEYYWDGKEWFYSIGTKSPQPISEWKGGNL